MARQINWRNNGDGACTARWKKQTVRNYYKQNDSDPDTFEMGCDLGFKIIYGKRGPSGTRWPVLQVLGIKNDKMNSKDVLMQINVRSAWQTKELIDSLITVAYALQGVTSDVIQQWLFMQLQACDTHEVLTPPTEEEQERYLNNPYIYRYSREF